MSRYSIRRTIAGWFVTAPHGEYRFAATHADAVEQVAKLEAARLGGWEWWPTVVPGRTGVYIINAFTGEHHHFRNYQQAAVFLAARAAAARKARA